MVELFFFFAKASWLNCIPLFGLGILTVVAVLRFVLSAVSEATLWSVIHRRRRSWSLVRTFNLLWSFRNIEALIVLTHRWVIYALSSGNNGKDNQISSLHLETTVQCVQGLPPWSHSGTHFSPHDSKKILWYCIRLPSHACHKLQCFLSDDNLPTRSKQKSCANSALCGSLEEASTGRTTNLGRGITVGHREHLWTSSSNVSFFNILCSLYNTNPCPWEPR